jgi:predicted phage terminase large subunit-like protein
VTSALASPAERLARLPRPLRREVLARIEPDPEKVRYCWPLWARPAQRPPMWRWRTWLVLAGRGFGKTRTGVEWVRAEVEAQRLGRLAIVAPTAADVRDTLVEGESGILATASPKFRPRYEPSKRRLTWPNGAIATTFSADEPDRFRGPQHDGALCDEMAAWKDPDASWDMLMFGLRLGTEPRAVVTTTPRPIPLVRRLVADPTTAVTRGSTYENAANLAPAFLDEIIKRYEGTRLGRQELLAEILDDIEGALWSRKMIDDARIGKASAPDLARVVVAIDPAVTHTDESDETGIVVAGQGVDGDYYVLDDLSCRLSPDGWATRAVSAYEAHKADRIVGEVNNGGELVESVLRTVGRTVAYKAVRASRGKAVRAEPVAALYEQGRVHHVGAFPKLEDQMCGWVPGAGDRSPDRMDALVWAMTELQEPVARFGVFTL